VVFTKNPLRKKGVLPVYRRLPGLSIRATKFVIDLAEQELCD